MELSAAQIDDGVLWTELLEELQREIARLEALEMPEIDEIRDEVLRKKFSLQASFMLSLRRLSEENRTYFIWLGILPEDASINSAMTTTLWGTSPRHASKTLRYLYNKALLMASLPVIVGEKEYPAYRLHDLLHDIACKLLITRTPQGLGFILPEAHAVLLERYKQRTQNGLWHTLADDGYIHSFLTWHMTRAGQEVQIHAVLREETAGGRSGWFQTRERLDQTAGFLEDLNLAWKLAEQEQHIGLQCRYALIMATFKSLAENIPADLLIALVKHGVWSPAQGLAYARQIPDPKKRVDVFGDLRPFLPRMLRDTILHEALSAAQAIQDGNYRLMALTVLAPHLPDALLHEALTAAHEIQNEGDRAQALAGLAERLAELPVAELRPLWCDFLMHSAQRTRAGLLSDLRALTPVIAKLGGEEGIVELFHAIQDVGRWWP